MCVCVYIYIHTLVYISRTHAVYMKPRKTSEVLKYSVSGRLSHSEKANSKCKLTIVERSPQSVNCIAIHKDGELLCCTQKELPSAVLIQGQRGATSSRTRVVKTQHYLQDEYCCSSGLSVHCKKTYLPPLPQGAD